MSRIPEPNPTSLNLNQGVEQCPLDMIRHGVDQTGCILGTVHVIRPQENGIQVIACVRSSSQEVHRFQILFKTNEDYLAALTMEPLDEFRLSLYGAELEKLAQIPRFSTLSMRLVYTKGVHIEWKSRSSGQSSRLNTWLCTLLRCLLYFILSIVALNSGRNKQS